MHMHMWMCISQERLEPESVHAAARRDSERGGGGGGGGARPRGDGGGRSGGDFEVYELSDSSGCSLEELQRVNMAAMTRAARGDPQGRCVL